MSRDRAPLPPPRIGFVDGLRAFAGGIGFVMATPAVWGYALVPLALVLLLSCGLGGLGIWLVLRLGEAWIEPISFGGHVGVVLLDTVLILAAVLFAVIVALGLAQPLSGFALAAIVDAQERALTGTTTPRPDLSSALWRAAWANLIPLALFVPVVIGLFFVGLLFPPAAVITVPLKFLLCSWFLAWNFLDYPLSLRNLGIGDSVGWFVRHFVAVTSFGIAWMLLAIVPGIVLLFLPMGVAGATRLVVRSGLVVGRGVKARFALSEQENFAPGHCNHHSTL
ncbi:MAG TPA: EI24 domain-containing protein [Gemmataceae bacterium]|nr:EI24 domain-containing protein [Gemmataceae bacterium]